MKQHSDIILRPVITEKSSNLREARKYTFEVAPKANKVEVKKAVEALFNVKVVKVNITNNVRKWRRVGKYEGLRPAVRKAVVTIAEGQRIDAFDI